MSERARQLLTSFDTLSAAEQQEVAAEILRRSSGSDGLSEDALHGLAAELFRSYEAEENARAQP